MKNCRYSRKQYEADKAQASEKLTEVRRKLAELERQAETNEVPICCFESWNDLYDEEYQLEQKLKSIERDWDTRNWTSADWQSHELVAMNID